MRRVRATMFIGKQQLVLHIPRATVCTFDIQHHRYLRRIANRGLSGAAIFFHFHKGTIFGTERKRN